VNGYLYRNLGYRFMRFDSVPERPAHTVPFQQQKAVRRPANTVTTA
jgi:hypothetical protein